MQFGISQKIRFGADTGAYSIVTEREYSDSQITLADHESSMLVDFYRGNIRSGNVRSDPGLAAKIFRRYPDGAPVQLNLVYPKPGKSELRIYIAVRAGFKPSAGSVWFLFIRNNEPWIGAMPEEQWYGEDLLIQDRDDEAYQEEIRTGVVRYTVSAGGRLLVRDRSLALQAIEQAAYRCEIDQAHPWFISRTGEHPYMEAHHLVPLAAQSKIPLPLDIPENIVCLCPFCHRAIHHAERPFVRQLVDGLLVRRGGAVLERFHLQRQDLYNLYALEDISRSPADGA